MDYVIAIPSHRRPEILNKRTLSYLNQTDVDVERIHLFLSDKRDAETYHIPWPTILCPDAKNATDKFNAIHNHFPVGTPVFVIEDDIERLCYRDEQARPQRQTVTELDEMLRASFDLLDGGGIWGINPHDSTHYTVMWTKVGSLKPTAKKYQCVDTLNLIVAHAFGFISTHDPALMVREVSKTDYERSCLYYMKYGKVFRRFDIGIKTKSYTNEGGMQANHTHKERAELEFKACNNLVERFPDLLAHNLDKQSPFAELRFRYGRRR